MTTPIKNITQIITPEVRDAILANSANLEEAINQAFKPFGFAFVKGQSLSKMVKESAQYQALDKKAQTVFFNRVKSTAKACYLGEQLTLDAVVHGYWARFNSTGIDKKNGDSLKQVNISFMAPTVAASREDQNMLTEVRQNRLDAKIAEMEAENARLSARNTELEAEVVSITEVK